MLNRIVIMGRLVRDPDLRRTQAGTAVAAFTMAVERDFKDAATGERVADFIDCVAWRQTGEFVSRYFTKGRMAVVEGRLQLRDWVDRDGNKRRNAEVIVEQMYFGDSKSDGGQKSGQLAPRENAGYRAYSSTGQGADEFQELQDDDGELPF